MSGAGSSLQVRLAMVAVRRLGYVLAIAGLLLVWPRSGLGGPGIDVGDGIRVVTKSTEVVEGELLDKTPQGYLIRTGDGSVVHVPYVEILALKELAGADDEGIRAGDVAGVDPVDAGVLHLFARPAALVEIDGVDHGTTEELSAGVSLPPGTYVVRFTCHGQECDKFRHRSARKSLVVEAGKATSFMADIFALNADEGDSTSPPTPPVAADTAELATVPLRSSLAERWPRGEVVNPKLLRPGEKLLLGGSFDVHFHGWLIAGATAHVPVLLGGSFQFGYKIFAANLVPELLISGAGFRDEGRWLDLPGEEYLGADGEFPEAYPEYNDPGELSLAVATVEAIPAVRYMLGMRRRWVFQPFAGVGVLVGADFYDAGGDLGYRIETAGGEVSYITSEEATDRTEFIVRPNFIVGFRVLNIQVRADFRPLHFQRISIGVAF